MLKVLAGIAALALIYVAGCTMYYNYLDPGIAALHQEFAQYDWDKDVYCTDPERDAGANIVVPSFCEGGLLKRRDAYLKEQHVFALGDWRKDSGFPWGDATFQLYIKYGL